MKDEDRDERGGREAGAGAPASPAPGASPPAGHPGFQTGVVYVEPDLRDEVQAYWQAYAAWERTRQGPPPREPRVSVRVDHADKPSTAARLREAMAPEDAARGAGGKSAGGKSAAEKSAGGSSCAGDEAAAVIDKNALPPAHRPGSAAAETKDGAETAARQGKARRAGTVAAMLALAAGIGAAAMCGVKEKAPAQSAAARGAAEASRERAASEAVPGGARAMSDAATSGAPAASEAAASGATADAASEAAAVVESAAESAPHEATVQRAAPTLKPAPLETVRGTASSSVDPVMRRPPAQRKTVKSPEQASENKPEPAGTAGPPAAARPAPTDLFEGTNYR